MSPERACRPRRPIAARTVVDDLRVGPSYRRSDDALDHSGGLAMILSQQPAQPLAADDVAGLLPDLYSGIDDLVLQPWMVAFRRQLNAR
jgi:hypothetical protein